MTAALESQRALKDLEAALAMPELPDRVARSFESLIDRLKRPVRVALLGARSRDRRRLLCAILGQAPLSAEADWPTLEMGYADRPRSCATLADGSTLTAEGLPGADLLAREPAFLRIDAPVEVLRRMTLLYLAVDADAVEQAAALKWAARRTDVAVWCTRRFSPREAAIWDAAPDRIKNHAHLVVLGNDDDLARVTKRSPGDFENMLALPKPEASALVRCIDASIDAALGEDMDVARMLLHRFGTTATASEPADAVRKDVAGIAERESCQSADRVALLSEPLLFLRRRARAIFETLDWQDERGDAWAPEVLEQCRETADGLRDRAAGWPDDDDDIAGLRQLVHDASDMAVLLQIEGGEDQASDAATLLYQLRCAFERALAMPRPLAN